MTLQDVRTVGETAIHAADPASRSIATRRLPTALVWAIAALALALPLTLCLRRSLTIDEYVYLHWAYEASRGVFAGADYFAIHLPFMQLFVAPVFWIERATPERGAELARVGFALMGTASVCLAFYAYDRVDGVTGTGISRRFGLPVVGLAAVAAGACDTYANRIVEVRPDNVYIFFLLLSVACFPGPRHRIRAWISGACFACALLSSEKMMVVALCLVAAHAAALVISREARGRFARQPLRPNGRDFVFGLVACCVGGVLVNTGGNLRGGVSQITALAIYLHEHERGRVPVPFSERPGAAGYVIVVLGSAASIAVVSAFAFFGKGTNEPGGSRGRFAWSPTYVALLSAGGLSYGIQTAPFEYSRTLLFVVAVPLLVDASATVLSRIPVHRGFAIAGAWAFFGALAYHGAVFARQSPSLDSQLAMLAEVRASTTSDDCVYDNSMGAFFREHAHSHYVTTDWIMRATQADALNAEIPPAILEQRCVAMMADGRTGGLPPALKRFLDDHFVPVSPYFWFYGTKLVTRTDVEDELAEPTDFFAPQTSWYLADPPDAQVRLSPDEPWTNRIQLERGNHKVFVSRLATRLVWQPRDGTPKPPYHGRADYRFSQL